jgi:hypothetical protein
MKDTNKKLNFGYSVAGLPTYIEELDNTFQSELLGKIRTLDYVTVHANIAGAGKNIYVATNDILFQAGGSCSENFSGSTSVDDVLLSVCPLTYAEQFCEDQLWDKYLSNYQRKGTDGVVDTLTFEEYWMDSKLKKIAVELDKIYFQGNTSTGTGNLALCDGVIAKLTPVSTEVTGLTFNVTNVIVDVQSMVAAISANLQDEELTLFVDPKIFGNLQLALFNGKYFDPNTFGAEQTYKLPFKPNVTVVSTIGLSGSMNAILGPAEHLHWGADLAPSDKSIRSGYDIKTDKIILRMKTKIGAQVTFGDYFVTNF